MYRTPLEAMSFAPEQEVCLRNGKQHRLAVQQGWTERVDEQGRTYYQNDVMKMTQWDRPETGEALRPPGYGGSVKCPTGHTMEMLSASSSWCCDVCKTSHKKDKNPHLRCTMCDYDTCKTCGDGAIYAMEHPEDVEFKRRRASIDLNAIELQQRREALGLTQQELREKLAADQKRVKAEAATTAMKYGGAVAPVVAPAAIACCAACAVM